MRSIDTMRGKLYSRLETFPEVAMNEYTILLLGLIFWLSWIIFRVGVSLKSLQRAETKIDTNYDVEILDESDEREDTLDIVA